MKDKKLAILFIIPSILIVIILNIYPIISVFQMSLTDRTIFSTSVNFIGLGKYISIFKDKNFLIALKNSFIWTISTTFLEVLFGTLIAMLLNRKFRFRGIIRAFILVPYVIPAIVSTLIWKYMLNDMFGLVNWILIKLNFTNQPVSFLSNPKLAMLMVISVDVWTFTPFVIISVLAALQSIDINLYDAAKVDGANNWKILMNIILPLISPVLVIVALLRTVWNFHNFDIIYLLTGGGPLMNTTTLPILIYDQAFRGFDLAKSAALAVIVFIIMIVLAMMYMRVFEKQEEKVN